MVAGIQGQDDKVNSQHTDLSLGASRADCDGVLEDVLEGPTPVPSLGDLGRHLSEVLVLRGVDEG